jgi:hypothetical protein
MYFIRAFLLEKDLEGQYLDILHEENMLKIKASVRTHVGAFPIPTNSWTVQFQKPVHKTKKLN